MVSTCGSPDGLRAGARRLKHLAAADDPLALNGLRVLSGMTTLSAEGFKIARRSDLNLRDYGGLRTGSEEVRMSLPWDTEIL